MKIFRIPTVASFTLIIFVLSCGEEDNGPGYKFIDQDAAGKIDKVNWTYADGYADIETFGTGSDLRVSVDLTIPQTEEGCDIFIPEGDMVFFSVPNEVGLYKLKLDLNCFTCADNITVTLFKKDGFENFIATEGAVEILAISDTEVSGRIDARYDGNTFVNGNFAVSICP